MIDQPYRPAPAVLQRLREVDFVAVIGPSAAGKTTLIRAAMEREPSLRLVLNNTSRPPRPDELDGVDYRFETRERMRERIALGEYAQVAPVLFGDLYATAADDYATDGVSLLPVLADALGDFRALPFRSLRSVYVLPPDWRTWRDRLAGRGFDPDRLASRLAEGRRSLEFALRDRDARFVINDDLDRATADFIAAATHHRPPERHRTAQHQDGNRATVGGQDRATGQDRDTRQDRARALLRDLLAALDGAPTTLH